MRILVIGATSTIATECERIWASDPNNQLTLVGRNAEHLDALKNDLHIRYPKATYEAVVCDFESPQEVESAVVSAGRIDVALIAHGQLTVQESAQDDLSVLSDSLSINAISPALFAEAIIKQMQLQGSGTLAVIGSVAGDRARRSNYVYGAAKGFLELYCDGLKHRLADTKIAVIFVKPGPTTSKMTLAMANPPKGMAEASAVAGDIVSACNKGKPLTMYTPKKWQLIMFVIRSIPNFVFKKLDI